MMSSVSDVKNSSAISNYPASSRDNNISQAFISAYASGNRLKNNNASLTGENLFRRAEQLNAQRRHRYDQKADNSFTLKAPKNIFARLAYALLMVSPFQGDGRYRAVTPHPGSTLPATSAVTRQDTTLFALPPRHKVKREVIPDSRRPRTDRFYLLAVFLNKNISAHLNPESCDDLQLAASLLDGVDRQPSIVPDVARLALSGSHFFGERRGETLSPIQHRGLVGQMLCRLIYQEESIPLRIAKLFAANRQVTQKEFAGVVNSWPYPAGFENSRRLWRENYEAPEIPGLYLNSLYAGQDEPDWRKNNHAVFLDVDTLWVGSLTWALMQFGARSIALENANNLNATSPFSMVELGLGLVSLFRQGLLATGVEPTFYLGLLLYYLHARPELDLGQILASDTLDPAFELLKSELENRHNTAQQLYDSVSYYQVNYQRQSWRTRQNAAEELLTLHCGSASAPLLRIHSPTDRYFRHYESNPVRQLMIRPAGQQCAENGTSIPDLDTFYRQEVDRFSKKIKSLDAAMLAATFLPSDFSDNSLQSAERRFLEHADIALVIPRLSRIRRPAEMFYSNVPVQSVGKPDTFFFQAQRVHQRQLFALQTIEQGYLLRKIVYSDVYLDELKPFMVNWPEPGLLAQYRFSLSYLNHNALLKRVNEALTVFLERYAEMHYQSYRQKIHEQGYQAIESPFPIVMETMAGVLIPFYSCINSLIAGQHHAAFAECLVDGALVGMPLVFTGVKAGLGLFREGTIGIGRTLSGPKFSASGAEIFTNRVPASRQIAGGVLATRSQIGFFMEVMGRDMLKRLDPGFAALRSLSLLTEGLYLALLGRTAMGLISWQPTLAKITGKIPAFVSVSHTLDFKLAYGDQADTPLTINVKGVAYSVMQIQNSSMVAVETGERTPDGRLMFAQLDLQNRFGIYKKYYCLYIGIANCQLTAYRLPDFRIEKTASIPRTQDGHFVWLLSTTSPINLVVVHPLYQVEYADQQWVLFEINGRRWAFSRDSGTLMPADNTDDWHVSPHDGKNFVSMIERGRNDTSLELRLRRLQGRRKRETGLHSLRTWRQLLTDYQLDDDEDFGFAANIHDDSSLSVPIGEARFLLTPEKNAATFLLRHPRSPTAPAFRVAYLIEEADFVFASPLEQLNSHRIGEILRRKITATPRPTQTVPVDILSPPLFNGAFRYGEQLFLKIGDRSLAIAPAGEYYHAMPVGEQEQLEGAWTLHYELFTGSFEFISPRMPFHPPDQGKNEFRSRFEKLAVRTFAKARYPTLAALCQPGNQTTVLSPAPQSYLDSRLRQVALLLRLDSRRRTELLHASSVALRAFRKDRRLAAEWIADFHPLALWATLERMVAACRLRSGEETLLTSRQLVQIEGQVWHFPAPILVASGPEPMLFIINHVPTPEGPPKETKFVIQLYIDRMAIQELVNEDGYRRWLPYCYDPQRTTVTKHTLAGTAQPMFWIDEAEQIWAQTPDGVKRRLFRHDSSQPIDDIVVSPDGATVVLINLSQPLAQRVLYYAIPAMGSQAGVEDLPCSKDITLNDPVAHGGVWWVTDQGELFVPRINHWRLADDEHPRWTTPEGYQPDFVSPDQRFVGYIKQDGYLRQHEVMLIDIITDKRRLLRRGRPFELEAFRLGKVVGVAFSALNALAAVGFSDGYIEIYRIDDEDNAEECVSLGGVNVPEGWLILDGARYPKLKQMVMTFNNAFDRLLVFHDIGDFSANSPGNGTYAITEISLTELQRPDV